MCLEKYEKVDIRIVKSDNVKVHFYENEEEPILIIKVIGKIPDGSQGTNDCYYIKQQIGQALIQTYYSAIIIDLAEMEYNWGNSIVAAFEIVYQLKFDENGFDTVYILSDKNKYGLSTLWSFDVENPREFIFYDLASAINYINERQDL